MDLLQGGMDFGILKKEFRQAIYKEEQPMQENMTLQVIAHVENDYTGKFGIPRQSGMVGAVSEIVFMPEYRDANALRGIEGYTHLWLIWGFHKFHDTKWSPMVKPPRLGGNKRMGVFATRSPNRPNKLGLSSVELVGVEQRPGKGTVLLVRGADMMHGTPVYDIKPYVAFVDSHPEASNGWADAKNDNRLEVEIPQELLEQIPEAKREAVQEILALDPRPAYQQDPTAPYGVSYGGQDIRFRVVDGCVHVFEIAQEDATHLK